MDSVQYASSRPRMLASIVPLSEDAAKMVRMPANRGFVSLARNITDAGDGFDDYCLGVSFTTIMGRDSVSCGSSRCNLIRCPIAKDVSPFQFSLRFELQTAMLLLTDVSSRGTSVSYSPAVNVPKTIRRATWPLLQETEIRFGKGDRFHFRIVLPGYKNTQGAFLQYFQKYMLSVDKRMVSLFGHTHLRKTVPTLVARKYIKVHTIGRGRFEVINTCLRLSDGCLLAIKTVSECTSPATQIDTSKSLLPRIDEAILLHRLKHPNIVRLVDKVQTREGTFLCTDFVPAGSIADVLMEKKILHQEIIRTLLRQTLRVLCYLHQRKMCHGSITPESILIRSEVPFNIKMCNLSQVRQTRSAAASTVISPHLVTEHQDDLLRGDIRALAMIAQQLLRPSSPDYAACAQDLGKGGTLRLPYGPLFCKMLDGDGDPGTQALECLQDPWLSDMQPTKRGRCESDPLPDRPKKRLRTLADTTYDLEARWMGRNDFLAPSPSPKGAPQDVWARAPSVPAMTDKSLSSHDPVRQVPKVQHNKAYSRVKGTEIVAAPSRALSWIQRCREVLHCLFEKCQAFGG